jgi:cytochrome c
MIYFFFAEHFLSTINIVMDYKFNSISISFFILVVSILVACQIPQDEKKFNRERDYIKPIQGKNETIPLEFAKKGKALISYSDCYICHKEDKESVGPAFADIAKRYPAKKVYLDLLANKIIIGGRGTWGTPLMDPHPELSFDDAKLMVYYIMSLKNQK